MAFFQQIFAALSKYSKMKRTITILITLFCLMANSNFSFAMREGGPGDTIILKGNEGQKVLDLRELSNGIYTVTVLCGEYYLTEKLVVTK